MDWSDLPKREENPGAGVNSWPDLYKVSMLLWPWRFPGPASLDGQHHSGLGQHRVSEWGEGMTSAYQLPSCPTPCNGRAKMDEDSFCLNTREILILLML
ncbi:hypothetical protein PAL_GLEAN10018303 [Pteropus alecto]|uniref:Uncharacterized protein n=1 Tax=Pteropus alecto TaxID=9402 RepID=L5JN71_PTEAL|nr:hypothetical protein PAL_GLEAN10018303 [Pteropus alecto]